MNGVTRRTYTVRTSSGPDSEYVDISKGLLTIEEAMAQTRVALVERFDQYLADHGLLSSARDHSLDIEPLGGAGHGMRLMDRCENRPCPWLGDPGDYSGPSKGERELFAAWFFVVDPSERR